jgi:hypothetical protein
MKYIYACGGGFEHVPASLEGPVGVFSMSIELCNGGSSGNGPIVIPIPGDIPGGSNQGPDVIIDPGEDDDQVEEPDDSGESDDGSNGEEPPPPPDSGCPQGMFPYPFPDSESGQYCIDCIQAQTLFCKVVSEYIRDIEDINKQLAAGGFPESASQAAIAKANYNIGIVCQLWHDYRCDEATGLDPVTIVKGCCPGCEALFLLWSLDGTE